jgi:hypothetical protein
MTIAGISWVTSGTQRTLRTSDAPKAASVALVPVVAAPRRLAPVAQGLTRPDPAFVAHLIAMAEMSLQTRVLRRAAPEDVHAAYRAVVQQNRTVSAPGVRMRQIA